MAKTILVVDDVAFVRKTLTEILTQAHYQVIGEASDGAEAIRKFETLHPDLVTMDIVMPQMSGIDAIKRIIGIEKNAKVIIISAMGQETLVMEAINVGAKDFILKPFSAKDVLKTVERTLLGEEYVIGRTTQHK